MRPRVVKLLFHFTCRLLLQSSIELAASRYVRPLSALSDFLSMLVYFCQTPDAIFALRRFGKRRGEWPHLTGGSPERTKYYERGTHTSSDGSPVKPAGGANPNYILEFPQTHINARFLSVIDNFGSSPDDR